MQTITKNVYTKNTKNSTDGYMYVLVGTNILNVLNEAESCESCDGDSIQDKMSASWLDFI